MLSCCAMVPSARSQHETSQRVYYNNDGTLGQPSTPADYKSYAVTSTPDASSSSGWSWETSSPQKLYGDRQGDVFNVQLPFYRSTFPGYSDLTPNTVKSAAGWVLLYKDFGTSSIGTSLPRFVIYNKYTGHLIMFVYNYKISETFTLGLVELSIINNTSSDTPKLLTMYSGNEKVINAAVNSVSSSHPKVVTAASRILPGEWFYAEFSLAGYDPDIGLSKYKDSRLQFSFVGVKETDIKLNGSTVVTPIYSEGSSNFFTSLSNIINAAPTGAVLNTIKFFSGKASSCEVDNTPESVKKACRGLEFLSPGVSGIVGWFGKLIGGSAGGRIIRYDGKITLQGSMTTRTDLSSFVIRVPGAQVSSSQEPSIYQNPLGVFAFRTPPVFQEYARRYDPCYIFNGDQYCDEEVDLGLAPSYSLSNNIVINPALTSSASGLSRNYTFSSKSSNNIFYSASQIASKRYNCAIDDYSGTIGCTANMFITRISFNPSSFPASVEKPNLYVSWELKSGFNRAVPMSSNDDLPTVAKVEPGTGVELGSVLVYPNPSNGTGVISYVSDPGKPSTVRIFDVLGRIVYESTTHSNSPNTKLNLSDAKLNSGVYIYRIQSGADQTSGSFVISR